MAATLTWLMQAEGAGAGESIFRSFKDGKVNHEEMPAYSELTRRLGFGKKILSI
jgi:hypothetical protein